MSHRCRRMTGMIGGVNFLWLLGGVVASTAARLFRRFLALLQLSLVLATLQAEQLLILLPVHKKHRISTYS